jgi:DNA polymerase I-like protein with 3'-5' exonuclease and polymerase domains
MSHRILFLGTIRDKAYLPRLKSVVGTASIIPVLEPITTLSEILIPCKKKGITRCISTNQVLLQKLVSLQGDTGRKKPSIDNYAGSYFQHDGMEFVFIDPLEQLVSVNYGAFLTRRYISKLASPEAWTAPVPTFQWCIATASNIESIYERLKNAYAIACDIETFSSPLSIRCCGYTAIFIEGGRITTESVVLPLDSRFALVWLRKLNELPAPKIFQNGKYDCSYLSMYNAVPYNYLWDTAHLFHSWYSELPKDLGFLQAFFVREAAYWKDLASSSDLHQYYLYNAKDTWATACVWMAQMLEMPAWATQNYLNEFPLVFPCHMAEMKGIKRDMVELKVAKEEADTKLLAEQGSLNRMLAIKPAHNFNVNSPVQMKQLLAVIGCKDLESADEKNLKKAALRHPLNARIIGRILSIRKTRKLISTYLGDGKEHNGYILYSLNPHGTDTSRLASREHHFWCGLQIQNIPRGAAVKRTLVADDGFRLAECDLEQAESRDTAYIAGDESLIKAVSGTRDFHSVNASAFFGVPYDSIYSDTLHKTIDKVIRDLAKRVNHGANYNMGPDVLVETMGLDKIWEAQLLLKLPKFWTPRQVAEHLLAAFHKTYPSISRIYYPGVVSEIVTTRMHSSRAIHTCEYQASSQGLTRFCFGHPDKNKRDLNSYVAHPPQSLNAMTLNKAFMKVFYELAINPVHSSNFRLHGQIHDSILFSFREGHEYLCEEVKQRMEIPVTVKGYDGKTRTFVVPAGIKAGRDGKGSIRWSEIE